MGIDVQTTMKLRFQVSVVLVGVFIFSGCGTMIRGSHQNIKVDSRPQGATVQITNCSTVKKTPAVFRLKRKQPRHTVVVRKEGYVAQKHTIRQVNSPISWLNLIFLPLAPFMVIADTNAGSNFKLLPTSIFSNLIALDSTRGRALVQTTIHELHILPDRVAAGSPFDFTVVYTIKDGTSVLGELPFECTYTILQNNTVLYQNSGNLTAPRGKRYQFTKKGVIAGKQTGAYDLNVVIHYKHAIAKKSARLYIV